MTQPATDRTSVPHLATYPRLFPTSTRMKVQKPSAKVNRKVSGNSGLDIWAQIGNGKGKEKASRRGEKVCQVPKTVAQSWKENIFGWVRYARYWKAVLEIGLAYCAKCI